MRRQALFYEKSEGDGAVRCLLCPHECFIKRGGWGICRVRKNIEGELYSEFYGEAVSVNLDPIEKKPLYHFLPGSATLSLGLSGCNMRCPFCQNHTISQEPRGAAEITPKEIVKAAKESRALSVAYTYSEPSVWFEFMAEVMTEAKKAGLLNVVVTNGMINPEPFKTLIPFISAMNVDLKTFTPENYRKMAGNLEMVKNSIKTAREAGIHLEITSLITPGINDDEEEFEKMCRWIGDLSKDIPLHISRYFPAYNYNEPATSLETMEKFTSLASKYLKFPYPGNVPGMSADTRCPRCGRIFIKRDGFRVKPVVTKPQCPFCGFWLPIKF